MNEWINVSDALPTNYKRSHIDTDTLISREEKKVRRKSHATAIDRSTEMNMYMQYAYRLGSGHDNPKII